MAISRNSKRWLIGGGITLLVLAAAVAVKAGNGKKDDEKKPDKVLAFNASEVVVPTQQALPAFIEFSGALVAPNTAVVRAKARVMPYSVLLLFPTSGSSLPHALLLFLLLLFLVLIALRISLTILIAFTVAFTIFLGRLSLRDCNQPHEG